MDNYIPIVISSDEDEPFENQPPVPLSIPIEYNIYEPTEKDIIVISDDSSDNDEHEPIETCFSNYEIERMSAVVLANSDLPRITDRPGPMSKTRRVLTNEEVIEQYKLTETKHKLYDYEKLSTLLKNKRHKLYKNEQPKIICLDSDSDESIYNTDIEVSNAGIIEYSMSEAAAQSVESTDISSMIEVSAQTGQSTDKSLMVEAPAQSKQTEGNPIMDSPSEITEENLNPMIEAADKSEQIVKT